jgi:cell wall-associated NlpC family hydrolase
MPAGSGDPGGKRPQVAAGFKVDSSSLQQLHTTWQLLIKDVQQFSKELGKIPTKNLTLINQALGRPAGSASAITSGGGGTSGSYIQPVSPAGASQQTSVQSSRGKQSPFKNANGTMNWGKVGGTVAAAGLVGTGSYMQSHLQNIANIDTLFTQTLGAASGSYIGAPGKNSLYNTVFGSPGHPGSGIGGFTSAQDFGQGYQSLQSTFGPGFANTAAGQSMLQQTGAMGNLPGNNFTNASDLASQLYSPQAFWALQRLGIYTTRPGGAKVPQSQIINQIISRVYGGKKVNAGQISSGLANGAPLQVTLSSLGFSSSAIQQIGQYAMANSQSGGGLNLNGGQPANTAANRAAGVTAGQSIQQSMNVASRASTNLEQQTGNQSRGSIEAYFQTFGGAVDTFAKTVNALTGGGGLGAMGGVGMITSPIGSLMSGPLGNLMQLMMFEKLLGGASGGGLGGLLSGGTGATGMAALLAKGGTSFGGLLKGAGIAGLGITATNVAQRAINQHTKPGSNARTVTSIGADAARGAAVGAGIGTAFDFIPGVDIAINTGTAAAVGAGVGAAYGGLSQLFGWGKHKTSPGDGVSGGGAPPGSGSGGVSTSSSGGSGVVGVAERYLGVPYHWGGTSPSSGFDCSGLVQYSYAQVGVSLPRTSQQQEHSGTEVSPKNARPGDLVFYGEPAYHVGIYMGNGKMIDAAHTGTNVRIENLWGGESHWRRVGGGSSAAVGNASSSSGSGASGGSSIASTAAGAFGNAFTGNFGSVDVTSAYATLLSGGVVMGGSTPRTSSTSSGSNTNTTPSASAGKTKYTGTNAQIGQKMAAARGWTGAEWDALYKLWMRESSWQTTATNSSSGAYGIPQSLPANKMASAGADWKTNPQTQMKWGMDYISGRYVDPLGAWAHEQQVGWYRTGTMRTQEGLAYLHGDEMVVPSGAANQFRQYAAKRKQREVASPNLSNKVIASGAKGGSVSVTISAPIHMPAGTTASDAKAYLQHVKSAMAEDDMFASLGAGD